MTDFRLYVGGIPYSAVEEDLKALFSQAGEVINVTIIRDRQMNNRSKGFGFVEMSNEADVTKAIEMFHDSEMDGRRLTVNKAQPREERPSTGASRGGNGGSSHGGDRGDRRY